MVDAFVRGENGVPRGGLHPECSVRPVPVVVLSEVLDHELFSCLAPRFCGTLSPLRDLPGARPFLRAVRDPYATIRTQEQVDHSTTRRVLLRVAEFEQAEHLELGVAGDYQDAD